MTPLDDPRDDAADAAIRLPDLGAAGPLRVSAWYVEAGEDVGLDDPLLEVVAGGIACDIFADRSGRITRRAVELDALVKTGDTLAWIERLSSPDL